MTWNEVIALLKNSTTAEEINTQREEIAEWIPAIRVMFEYDQNNDYHQYDLWMHSVHTVLGLPRNIEDDMLYLAALLHDIGKPESRCQGKRPEDTNSHYYGHPAKSEEIVREQVIPYIIDKGQLLSEEEEERLLYYVKYHDDHVSLRVKHLKRHLQMVSLEEFKKLMLLEVADAKAHVIHPIIQARIDICGKWSTSYADEMLEQIENSQNE